VFAAHGVPPGVDLPRTRSFERKEVYVEAIISNLVTRFERGALTRRELIRGLAMLTATSGTATAGLQEAGIKGAKIDHVSIQVTNLQRSIGFYQKMFGLSVVSEDKSNEIVRLGITKPLVSLHHKSPTGIVDHFAIGVEQFNKESVTRDLKQRGATPEENIDAGFHIKDPEGLSVQIVQS
jgi:catechol 2,3-dioxygenase-like lactoylglutathione lyase family enzyme